MPHPYKSSPLESVSDSVRSGKASGTHFTPEPCKFLYSPSGPGSLGPYTTSDFLRMYWLFLWQEPLPPSHELSLIELLPLFLWQFWTLIGGHLCFSTLKSEKCYPVRLMEEFLIRTGQRARGAKLGLWKKNFWKQDSKSWGHLGISAGPPCLPSLLRLLPTYIMSQLKLFPSDSLSSYSRSFLLSSHITFLIYIL